MLRETRDMIERHVRAAGEIVAKKPPDPLGDMLEKQARMRTKMDDLLERQLRRGPGIPAEEATKPLILLDSPESPD